MKYVPHPFAILFSVAILFFANLPGRCVNATDAPSVRQLPTEIHADQTVPDITVTGGFGQAAGIGDFNGDGVSDFLVKYARFIGEASSYVFFKLGIIFGKRNQAQPVTINLITDEPDLTLTTQFKSPFWDSEITTPGDLNGDGIDDILLFHVKVISAPGEPTEPMYKLLYGSSRFAPGVVDIDALPADLTIIPRASGLSSLSVAGAADVNGDGAKDLLLAVQTFVSNSDAAFLLGPFAPGAVIDLNARTPDILIHSQGFGQIFVADLNGDHLADLLFKRSQSERDDGPYFTYFTAVDVVFGATGWKPGTEISLTERAPDATIIAGFNLTVIQAGDVNGDGISDLLVGRPTHYGGPPPSWFTGEVSIFFGSPALRGSISQPDVVINGLPVPEPFHPAFQTVLGDNLGQSMAVSDVNGDGQPDILIGAPGATSNDKGKVLYMSRAHIIIGSPELKPGARIDTSSTQQDVTISFGAKASGFGRRVASGDFNGDGVGDILVSNDGVAYVYFGGPLSAPPVTAAKYRSKAGELRVFGQNLNGAARVEVNGVLIDQPVVFDAAEAALVLRGTPAELNLRDGKNQVVVLRKGARSNAVKVKVK